MTFKKQTIYFILLMLPLWRNSIPCIPYTLPPAEKVILQLMGTLCHRKNIKMPGQEVWGMDKMHRKKKIGSGSYGSVYLLLDNQVYKEMIIENPENFLKAYNEVNISGCLNLISQDFASAKECYYFTERLQGSPGTKLSVWMLMDQFQTDLKKVLGNKFNKLAFVLGQKQWSLEQWKHHTMLSLAHQIYQMHTTTFQEHNEPKNQVKGILHRDIKSENIMMDYEFNAHFGDFGFSTFGTRSVDKIGTPEYGAPEMFSDSSRGPFGLEIDVFSLGVVFYEILNSSPSHTIYASNHFSMELGHQKAFTASDFPGYEWMAQMVDYDPKSRLTIRDVLDNLNNQVVGARTKQVHQMGQPQVQMEQEEVVQRKHRANQMNVDQQRKYQATVMDSDFQNKQMRMGVEMKQGAFDIKNQGRMKAPELALNQMQAKDNRQALVNKADQLGKFEGFNRQNNSQNQVMQKNKAQILKPNQQVFQKQMMQLDPIIYQIQEPKKEREFNPHIDIYKDYQNIITRRKFKVEESNPQFKINKSGQISQAPKPVNGSKILNDRENFRQKIFGSQIQFRRQLI